MLARATPAAGVALAILAGGAAVCAQQVPTSPPDAAATQPTTPPSPLGLRDSFYQASVRVSRAARHLVSFETRTNATPETAASFADAATVTSEVLVNIAAQPGGTSDLAGIARVVIAEGAGSSAVLSNGVLTVTFIPATGAAVFLPPGAIYAAVRGVTCITTTQVIERTTFEACAAALKDDYLALRAKGLAAAAPLLIVSAHGQVLRGASTATLVGRHGEVTASDGALTCHGDYDSGAPWQTTDIAFRCSDGRTGVAKRAWSTTSSLSLEGVHRVQVGDLSPTEDPMLVAAPFVSQGEGALRMSDGEVARFAFGCATRIGDIRTCPVVKAGQASSLAQPAVGSR